MPRQRPLAQLRLLLRTASPTSPGSASLLLAPRCLLPALLPPASARSPAHCAHPTPPAQPSTSGRECGSAGKTPDAALLPSPASLPLHAATPPFHTDHRNPALSISPHGSCAEPWPSSHTGRLLPTLLPEHSSCTTATGRPPARVPALTSLLPLLPPPASCAPLPLVARRDSHSPGQ